MFNRFHDLWSGGQGDQQPDAPPHPSIAESSHAPNGTISPQQLFLPPQAANFSYPSSDTGIQPATYPSHPTPNFASPAFTTHSFQPSTFVPREDPNLTQAGPTQTRKPKPTHQGDQNGPGASAPNFDSRLLNPKAASANPPTSGDSNEKDAAEQNGTNSDAQSGMGSMIERMHNVSNREAAPPRKRKSETHEEQEPGPENKKPKAAFSASSNGGLLKDERKKYADAPGPSNQPIDLTGGDDDEEIVITGENIKEQQSRDEEEVCVGVVICHANISRLPAPGRRPTAEEWPRTKLRIHREVSADLRIDLLDRDNRKCGYLEFKVASALTPFLNAQHQNKLRLAAYLDAHPREKGEEVGARVSKLLRLNLVIHVPQKSADMIARSLSQRQLFLSSPQSLGLNITGRYYNPHDIRHVHGPNALAGNARRPQTTQPMAPSLTVEQVQMETSKMFDQLIKSEELPEREPESDIVRTELMSHQKQALYFLMDHEAAQQDEDGDGPNYSLWRPTMDGKGNQHWYNVITPQLLAQKPEPLRGGILADMMGLGKTLSILSLIAETKRESRLFHTEAPPKDSGLARNSKATLIICPKSVMSNWTEQIRTHCNQQKVKTYTYHGSSRTEDLDELSEYNVVLTTYNTAASEFSAKDKPLALINWFRIVLDEAHQIRNQTTQVSKACCALSAQRRWAVTGTPVQNGLGDLGSLIKFLRVKPFDETTIWNQYIVAPFRSGEAKTLEKLRLLVDSITLRRMKDKINLRNRSVHIARLEFTENDRKIYAQLAREAGSKFHQMTGGARQTALKGRAYAHILKALGRLRAFCAHGLDMFSDEDRKDIMEGYDPENAIAIDLGDEPDAENYKVASEREAYETLHLFSDMNQDRCEKCNRKIGEEKSETVENAEVEESSSSDEEDGDDTIGYLNQCYHLFCPKCKDIYVQQAQATMTADLHHICPCCSAYIRFGLFDYHQSTLTETTEARLTKMKDKRNKRAIRNYETTYEGPSPKVQALLNELKQSAATPVPEGEPPIRSVVFSGWTTYLDLIEIALQDHEIGFLRLDGSMSVKQRTDVLSRFNSDPTITTLLVSIKAGGQGLNFTAASKVYMMEPQYNPGVEDQAIDRVHRLGQNRDVEVVHYIMQDSVEEGIVKLQTKKKDLANFTMERKMGKEEAARRRIEGLKDLFK